MKVLGWFSWRGYRAVYIGGSVNSGPSDQTDLKGQCRCNLGGGGKLTYEGGADVWAPSSVVCFLESSGTF